MSITLLRQCPKGEEPGGDRSADVGTHDNAGGLTQAITPELTIDDHHRCSGGTLDNGIHTETQPSLSIYCWSASEYCLQPGAGAALRPAPMTLMPKTGRVAQKRKHQKYSFWLLC